jgi:hypothetical protein
MAAALAEYHLGAVEGITPDERRMLAERRVQAMTPAERARLAEANQIRNDSAAQRLNASAVAVDGPAARLLKPSPARHAPGFREDHQ